MQAARPEKTCEGKQCPTAQQQLAFNSYYAAVQCRPTYEKAARILVRRTQASTLWTVPGAGLGELFMVHVLDLHWWQFTATCSASFPCPNLLPHFHMPVAFHLGHSENSGYRKMISPGSLCLITDGSLQWNSTVTNHLFKNLTNLGRLTQFTSKETGGWHHDHGVNGCHLFF